MSSPQLHEVPALEGPFRVVSEPSRHEISGECTDNFSNEEARAIYDAKVYTHLGQIMAGEAGMVVLERCVNRVTGEGSDERHTLQVSYAAAIERNSIWFVDRFYEDDNIHRASPRQLRALGAPAVRSDISPEEVPALLMLESVIPDSKKIELIALRLVPDLPAPLANHLPAAS